MSKTIEVEKLAVKDFVSAQVWRLSKKELVKYVSMLVSDRQAWCVQNVGAKRGGLIEAFAKCTYQDFTTYYNTITRDKLREIAFAELDLLGKRGGATL
ncbi:hypothetical protein [Listeria phage LP-KV022]|uniref:Uncharacterized protein n=2 Tax=Homburgvirus LP110 TaxID=1921128 RepID=A0A5A4K5U7_9CAUD|nr:hypothetical protein LP110_018 [Listeria phage LP-110]AGI11521.1 hypothetical protein LP110_018 [Listeria phage LP-110]AWY07712.1 hypothetical protein [Listeria phage LP-KV022]